MTRTWLLPATATYARVAVRRGMRAAQRVAAVAVRMPTATAILRILPPISVRRLERAVERRLQGLARQIPHPRGHPHAVERPRVERRARIERPDAAGAVRRDGAGDGG